MPRGGSKSIDSWSFWEICSEGAEVRFIVTARGMDGKRDQTTLGGAPGSRGSGNKLGVGGEAVEAEGGIFDEHAHADVDGHNAHELV